MALEALLGWRRGKNQGGVRRAEEQKNRRAEEQKSRRTEEQKSRRTEEQKSKRTGQRTGGRTKGRKNSTDSGWLPRRSSSVLLLFFPSVLLLFCSSVLLFFPIRIFGPLPDSRFRIADRRIDKKTAGRHSGGRRLVISGQPVLSRKPSSCRLRTGCCSLRTALASIWRTRSRVTLKIRPTSSRV